MLACVAALAPVLRQEAEAGDDDADQRRSRSSAPSRRHSPIAAPIRANGAANTALWVAAARASRPFAVSASLTALEGVLASSTGV